MEEKRLYGIGIDKTFSNRGIVICLGRIFLTIQYVPKFKRLKSYYYDLTQCPPKISYFFGLGIEY